jgi:hypothetical protein
MVFLEGGYLLSPPFVSEDKSSMLLQDIHVHLQDKTTCYHSAKDFIRNEAVLKYFLVWVAVFAPI